MTTGSTGTKRRTFFQRGLALLAGGAALGGSARWAGAATPPAPSAGNTLRLYARVRPVAGHQHRSDGRILATGDLLDSLDGESIGTFYANCFCAQTPFGVLAAAPSTMELHVLQLKDGTLFGMGSGRDAAGQQPVAIIGGTGRFAGRSGAYLLHPIAAGSRDVRELTITFAG